MEQLHKHVKVESVRITEPVDYDHLVTLEIDDKTEFLPVAFKNEDGETLFKVDHDSIPNLIEGLKLMYREEF